MNEKTEWNAPFGLEGKVAIITGAGSGIGREIAALFSQAGATVVGTDINKAGLDATIEVLTRINGDVKHLSIHTDQGDPASIEAGFKTIREAKIEPDILVNCAAIYPFKPFEELDAAFLDLNLAINLRGVLLCTQQAVRLMKVTGRGGSVISMASVFAKRALTFDNVHYGMIKASINNMTALLALEYGKQNIRFNSIMPGVIMTENAMKIAENYPLRGPMTESDRIPLGRYGQPIDIARTCLFLASDASAYVTGQMIAVDGGFLVS